MIAGKSLYDRLPIWGQTVTLNLVSARNFRTKYGPTFYETLGRLEQNDRKSLDQSIAEQRTAIKRMLAYARAHVPHYRRLDCSPEKLSEWPILEKATVATRPEDFLSDEFPARDLLTLRTSGTTGTPLAVRITKAYHQTEMAFRWRHRAWGGVPFPSRAAYFSGHAVVPPGQRRPPFWRADLVEKRLLCSSYHLTWANLPSYIEALRRYSPDFVHGYPSSLFLLARHLLERGLTDVRPRAVFTASETLLDFQRAAIEKAFGTKVHNWYGNSEMTCNIVECAAGALHYRMDYGVLELLGDGTMLCSGLNNLAMPLIRYRVGDVAFARSGVCGCGIEFPMIERIEGRVEDYVRTPDGRWIGRLDHLFKNAVHVREAQLVQPAIDELIIRIVPHEGYSNTEEQVILTEALQRLGESIRLRFEYVSELERTEAGKVRFVVSRLRGRPIIFTPL